MTDNQGLSGAIQFKDTLNLPRTEFPIRSNALIDDPVMVERWKQEGLYAQAFVCNEGSEKFILHDGPPYANGNIHLGHAYNKILKDIVTKSQRMLGKHVPVIPGWDCHGLPIEKRVTDENPHLSGAQLKAACRAYAQRWIAIQKEEFQRLGVIMHWEQPYLTMDPAYEATIMRSFGAFLQKGYIERKDKTVPWCASCKTVLASAEIEYQERKDPSVYVLFALDTKTVDQLLPDLATKQVNLLVWTTTPWTLPLNRAVAIRPATSYAVVDVEGTYSIVADALVDSLARLFNKPMQRIALVNSDEIVALQAKVAHPFITNFYVPVLLSDTVSLEDGTACVHQAPGCGPEDYEFGIKNNLEIFSPVSVDGRYTKGVIPTELEGMSVTDGQVWVIKKVAEGERLLFKTTIRHSYPHCWRCRNGLIFRATRQWFCDLSKEELKQRTLAEVDSITMLPKSSVNRLKATIEGRLEWCLSRQRVWGVPIPAVICAECDHAYSSVELIEQVAKEVETQGIEYWDAVSIEKLLPQGYRCEECFSQRFVKEQDILDVWFDSGVSHAAVLKPNHQFPADVYLEGKDQHRGWFQSSLLTSVVLEGRAPMHMIVTHGFTVDSQGRKMSKSLNNGVAPQDLIKQLGTDGLRLWAASIDCSGEAVVSDLLVTNVKEVFRKVRNTARFLLSNLYDFTYETDAVPLDELLVIDRYALQLLADVNTKVIEQYQAFEFTAIFHTIADFCANDLSAFYLDVTKDRLYVERADGHLRRSAQTVYWQIVDTLTRLIAPIMSFTAEQLSDQYQKNKEKSIHLQAFVATQDVFDDAELIKRQWGLLKQIRSSVLKAVEPLREQGIIKHPLETKVTLYFDEQVRSDLAVLFNIIATSPQGMVPFLKEFFIASQVILAATDDTLEKTPVRGCFVQVSHADGTKCPRCWQWEVTTHKDYLCGRCSLLV